MLRVKKSWWQRSECLPTTVCWASLWKANGVHVQRLIDVIVICPVHTGVFIFSAVLLRAYGAREASGLLHCNLLVNMFRLPMVFFDTTPQGRIVNRFSKDMDVVDTNIPSNMQMFLTYLLKVVCVLGVIAVTNPLILLAAVPLGIFYLMIQVWVFTARGIVYFFVGSSVGIKSVGDCLLFVGSGVGIKSVLSVGSSPAVNCHRTLYTFSFRYKT